ncbi:hypothetical protein [Nevskia ramosa]|uniref:hypothetical protein n=1 Tax=Nevskia ramosa TaxID=64002 RepID=UPI002357D339|nr:hypothetical protein [Nevskia ramosa]
MQRCQTMPGKPGNMPPKEREKYFASVRRHAEALIDALAETRFDSPIDGIEVDIENFDAEKELWSWGDDEYDSGHIVAFNVRPDGVFKMYWDYPNSALVHTLVDLIAWTRDEDCWDRDIMITSAPIAQANAANARAIYFNCTLWERWKRHDISIPFPVLATICNVALDLGPNESLDEDAVRKQVRRYESRMNTRLGPRHFKSFGSDEDQEF